MRSYTLKSGRFLKRDVHLAASSWKCHGCSVPILKGEFYIKDTVSEVKRNYPRYGSFAGTPQDKLMVLSWHMACAPLTRDETAKVILTAIEERIKENPTKLEEANNA